MKARILIAAVIFLPLAGATAIISPKPLQVTYRRRALERWHEEIYAEPSVTSAGIADYL